MRIQRLDEPRGQDVLELLDPIEHALDSGPAVCIDDEPGNRPDNQEGDAGNADVALAVRTSGSTGKRKLVLLSASALRASAEATSRRLAGPGSWLLPLSVAHIAGMQVVVRSVLAGTTPTVMDIDRPFTADAFADAVDRMPAGPRYVSLVPTQLTRVLADARARAAAASFDAVLVGGAAPAPATIQAAKQAGIAVVVTYGMSETCGGCVYDGVPLDGVLARTGDAGRISLGGSVVAEGYLLGGMFEANGFDVDADGTRWFTTNDLGAADGDVVTVTGRADDIIVSGGTNVSPAPVEAALTRMDGVAEALVIGVPDEEWGLAVTALIVPGNDRVPGLDVIRAALKPVVGAEAAPRAVVTVDGLPLRASGKPDRTRAAAIAARELSAPSGEVSA